MVKRFAIFFLFITTVSCFSQSFSNIEEFEIYGLFKNMGESMPPYEYSEDKVKASIAKAVPVPSLSYNVINFLPHPLIGRIKLSGEYYIFLYFEGGIIELIDYDQVSVKYYYDKELAEKTFEDW